MFPEALANRWIDGVEAELMQDLPFTERDLIGANAPPKAKRVYKRVCPETGDAFETTGKDRLFSTDKAKADFHNRSSSVGRRLVPIAKAWRLGRNAKGNSPLARARRASANGAFMEMCRIIDEACADDREEGRMPALDYIRRRAAISGAISPQETVAYQTKLVAAIEVIRKRLGAAADAMTDRDLGDLAAAEVARNLRQEKLAIIAAMGVKV